jgi:transposase
MAEPYPIELRTRVVTAYEAGDGSYAMLAEQFAVGSATVKRWVRQRRREGHLHPKPKAGGARSTVAGGELEHLIIVLADPTAGELTAAYNRTRRGRQRVHVSSIKRALHRQDYVVKKNAAGRRKWTGRTSTPGDGRS